MENSASTPQTSPLRFAIFGTGFWAQFQLAAWRELEGVECVALFNRTLAKAERLAAQFGIPNVYDDAEALLKAEKLDFLDIITDVDTHARFVEMAARYRVPVICQKPMAPDLETARGMVETCRAVQVPLWIHENWRFQTPIQALKAELERAPTGTPFRFNLKMVTGFPVFANQPFLRDLEQFLIADLGSHLFDVLRFLAGEVHSVYCTTQRIHPDIRGEDCVSACFQMRSGATAICQMAYAENFLEAEHFPETLITVESSQGSIELSPHCWIRTTTRQGTFAKRAAPHHYAWADPAYDLVHASIVPCNADILADLRGERAAQTRACDNLKTAELVFSAYESAAHNKVVTL